MSVAHVYGRIHKEDNSHSELCQARIRAIRASIPAKTKVRWKCPLFLEPPQEPDDRAQNPNVAPISRIVGERWWLRIAWAMYSKILRWIGERLSLMVSSSECGDLPQSHLACRTQFRRASAEYPIFSAIELILAY